jgi:hypothetical protein
VTPAAAIAIGLALVLLGIPMILHWIPRVRIHHRWLPGLSVSDDVWYESHRRSGWDFVLMGVGLIFLTVWIAPSPEPSAAVRDFLGVSTIVGLMVAAVRSVVVTLRLSRDEDSAPLF